MAVAQVLQPKRERPQAVCSRTPGLGSTKAAVGLRRGLVLQDPSPSTADGCPSIRGSCCTCLLLPGEVNPHYLASWRGKGIFLPSSSIWPRSWGLIHAQWPE